MDRPGVPWSNPPSSPSNDWVPWSNPPSSPTLDWANGGADLPPEVSSAIGRFRMQAWNDRDRQVLTDYLVTNGDQLSAQEQTALGDIIHAMSGPQVGAPSSGPSQALPQPVSAPPFTYVPGGGDIRSQIAAQAGAPANLPTPAPPPVTATASSIPLSPNDPAMLGPQGTTPALQQPQMASVRNPGILPTPTPSVPGSMPAGGYGASNIAARAARQQARGDARGAQGSGTNWKGIEGLGPDSAFADVQLQYRDAMAHSPSMAAQELVNQGLPPGQTAPITAKAMEPLVGSALNMATLGLLGGGHGHGLGGPGSSSQRLARAEDLVNSLGPGQYIDPGSVLRQTLRRAGKTPIGDLQTGQGDPNDLMQQVKVTQDAILGSLGGVATDDAYNGTATMLEQEANSWLMAVAHGEIDPNVTSYPAWLREHKRQKYLGR